MNSNELKSRFHSVYKKFFSENPIVISMPFVMSWSGDYSIQFNWVNIKQKIPLRIYVGISSNREEGIQLWTIEYYDPVVDVFLEDSLVNYSDHFKNVQRSLKDATGIDIEWWIILNVLSELPWTIWLGFESILWMLLITWVERVKKNIDHAKIADIQNQRLDELWNNYQEILSPLFNASYWYLIHSYKSFPITGDISTSFYNGEYPFVTLSISESFAGDYEKIIYKWGWAQVFRFNELMDDECVFSHLPIDYGIVYSWQPMVTQQILNATTHALDWVEQTKNQLHKVFHTYLNKKWSWASDLYKSILDSGNHDFENVYTNLMLVVSFEIFDLMMRIYTKWFSEENITMFLFSLNKLRYSNYVRYHSQWFFHFISEIEKHINLPNVLALSPNDTTIMWWTINFAFPLGRYRTHLRAGIEKVQEIHKWSCIIYENWIDWVEEGGIVFEQDIQLGIYSSYLQEKSFLFRSWWKVIAMDGEDFDLAKMNEEIILDKIRNKILINGEYIGSKELSSQSATIEILSHILEGEWKEIHCRSLVISSYSKNKNEMFSKVLNPFMKLVSEKIGKKVSVLCTGSIDDFYLKIDLGGTIISTLEKMNQHL